MDPLSVSSGIVGILAASGQLISTLYLLGSNIKDALADTEAAVEELSTITIIVKSLQGYLLNRTRASPQRLQLITVEQITASLTGCIVTYSELDKTLKSLHVDDGMNIWDKTLWLLKKDKVTTLILRIQNHKATFTMMLNILQSQSMGEAEKSMERLCDAVGEVLRSNQDLALRLRAIEDLNRRLTKISSTRGSRLAYTSIRNSSTSTVRGRSSILASGNDPSQSFNAQFTSVRDSTISEHELVSSFEELLNRSRVYRHVADNDSLFSISLNDGRTTLALSFCSSLTLGEVSNISVFALPVYASELSNAVCYTQFGTTNDSNTTIQSPTTGPVTTSPSPSTSIGTGIGREDLASWWKGLKRGLRAGNPPAVHQPQTVFRMPIEVSIRYASVPVSFPDREGHPVVCGHVPVVLAKCTAFLRAKAPTKSPLFLDRGFPQNVQALQTAFDTAPSYGRDLDWGEYTVYDAADVLQRYLRRLPGPLIPLDCYKSFRDSFGLAVQVEGRIVDFADPGAFARNFRASFAWLPEANRWALSYLLDFLAGIASGQGGNGAGGAGGLSVATLAAIFQPVILRHPDHDLDAWERDFSRAIVCFLVGNRAAYEGVRAGEGVGVKEGEMF